MGYNILIIGDDPTLLKKGSESNTKDRHIEYAKTLNKKRPGSKIYVITNCKRSEKLKPTKLSDNLFVYPTNSVSRFFLFFYIMKIGLTIIRKNKIDLITTQSPFDDGIAGYILSKLCNAKFNPQVHFDFLSERWLNKGVIQKLLKHIGIITIKKSENVRVVSTCLKKKLINKKIDSKKISIIPVYIDINKHKNINKNNYKKIRNKKTVLFVGRLNFQKNVPLFIEVAKKLSDDFKDIKFIIVGKGPEQKKIENLIDEYKLKTSVKLLGFVSNTKLSELYDSADIFFLPSYFEGFGLVVIESYLHELPVVSTRSCGPEDIIVNNETGYLIDKDDIKTAASKIKYLLNNQEKAKEMGRKGYIYIRKKFDSKVLINNLINNWIETIET